MREKLEKLLRFAPVLSIVVVAVCIGVSLSDYKTPVYAAKDFMTEEQANAENASEEESETEAESESEGVSGNFDLEDGVYEGTGTGFAGKMTVAVTIKDKSITAIEVLKSSDDAAFLNRAKTLIDKMIAAQSYDVDTVSGATFSSKGIIAAVKNALTGEIDSSTGNTQNTQNTGAASGSSAEVETVEDAKAYKDGTYYGTGTGFGGKMKVKVTISDGKIAGIDVVENNDDQSFMQKASAVISRILSTQSTNVDTVSGATYSSAGIIRAVRSALSQAAVNGDSTETDENGNGAGDDETADGNNAGSNTAVSGTIPYDDGIYYGTAEGYLDDITVAVVIQENTIKAVLVTESEDDEAFLNRAIQVAENVVTKQTTEVDVVSGATYSSNGILQAIKNALAEAEKITNGELPEEETVDYTVLNERIKAAEQLKKDNYTEKSWMLLEIRLQDAKDAGNSQIQEMVDLAAAKLKDAMNSLVKADTGNEGNSGDGDSSGDSGNQDENEGNTDSGDEDNSGSDTGNDEKVNIYKDGVYKVSVLCQPDEYEDFDAYNLSLTLTLENDKIISITDIVGDGDSSNDSYIKRAAYGTSKVTGVVDQILNKGTAEGVDAVSRATCSSNSIVEACKKALENALNTIKEKVE